jgi:hypothetical protein
MTILINDGVRVFTADSLSDVLWNSTQVRRLLAGRVEGRGRLKKAARCELERAAAAFRAALNEALGESTCVVTAGGHDPLVDQAVCDIAERVPPIVHARRERLSEENISALVDFYLKSEPTSQARHTIEHNNARMRAMFVEEFDCLSSAELATLAGHGAKNASATATRWKKAGKIFGLPWRGADIYPAFQFADGRPRDGLAPILAELSTLTPWQIAFWFTSSNGWLDGKTPAECLENKQVEQVIEAAHREGEALVG